jgi:hypothetical protein
MDLINILRNGIGKKVFLNLSSINIHMSSNNYSSFGELYIGFYEKLNENTCYLVNTKGINFDDNIHPLIQGEPHTNSPLSYETFKKYTITCEEIPKEKYNNRPVFLGNGYFELIEITVFKKRVGNMKHKYEELSESMDFSPELYFLKFAKGNEIIIYFNIHMSLKHIYCERADFLNDTSRIGISLDDFEQVSNIPN